MLLNARTPGDTPGHDENIYKVTSDRNNSQNPSPAQSFTCRQCAFYEVIARKRGYRYGLCHFTGLHDPQPGQNGCHFMPGKWEDIDSILGLTSSESKTILDFPNQVRLCKSLAHSQDGQKIARHTTAIHALADNVGKWFEHIGEFTRPGSGNTRAAHLAGERVSSLFLFSKSQPSEAKMPTVKFTDKSKKTQKEQEKSGIQYGDLLFHARDDIARARSMFAFLSKATRQLLHDNAKLSDLELRGLDWCMFSGDVELQKSEEMIKVELTALGRLSNERH